MNGKMLLVGILGSVYLVGCGLVLNDKRIARKMSKYISEGGDVPSFTGMTDSGENHFAKKLVEMMNTVKLSDAKRARALVVIDLLNTRRESRGIFGYAIQY